MNVTTTAQTSVERIAQSYAGALYLLPCDDEERQRLIGQHELYTRLLSHRLILPPISFSEKDDILDIGTGAGAWLCDVRTHLPDSVQLYGIDIESRLFPSHTAPSANIHLAVCSGTNLPSYWSSKFALVHQRLLICAYTCDQWRQGIDEIYRVLKPGGYAQFIENGPEWVSGPRTAKQLLFIDDLLGSKNMMFRCGTYIADMLRAAGFVEVTSEKVVMKLGKWAGKDGVQASDMLIGAWKGLRDSVMRAGGLGRFKSGEEFIKSMDELVEEWDTIEGSHSVLSVFYARKPL